MRTAELVQPNSHWADPLHLGVASNLFQIQAILCEAALAYRLGGDRRLLGYIDGVAMAVADSALRHPRLPSEAHQAYVLVGLCVAWELGGTEHSRDLLEQAIAATAGELWASAQREQWGEDILKRNAWNQSAVCFAALGCAGMVSEEPDAPAWLAAARQRTLTFFRDGITDTGMTREGLTYCGFVMRNLAPFLHALRNRGDWDYRDPHQNPYLDRLTRIPDWYAVEVFPCGSYLQNAGDSYWEPGMALGGFLSVFRDLAPAQVATVWDALVGTRGDGSLGSDRQFRTSVRFDAVLWPTDVPQTPEIAPAFIVDNDVGWVTEADVEAPGHRFSLICGRYIGGIHDQSDNGSVTLFGSGVPLLLDSGAANDPVEGSRSASGAHNLVMVDDRGQLPAGAGNGVSATLVALRRGSSVTIATMDLAESYAISNYNVLACALRHCVYVRTPFPYLIVIDDFRRPDGTPAKYERRWHTPKTGDVGPTLEGSTIRLKLAFGDAESDLFLQALDDDVTIGRDTLMDGPPPFPHHDVWTMSKTAVGAVMATVILPLDPDTLPGLTTEVDLEAGRLQLSWERADTTVDVITFEPGAAQAPVLTRNRAEEPTENVLPATTAESAPTPARAPAGNDPRPALARRVLQRLPMRGGWSTPADQAPEDPSPSPVAVDDPARQRLHRLARLTTALEQVDNDPDFPSPPEHRAIARDFLDHFVAFADLDPDADVLDAGCGSGGTAAALMHYLRHGTYVGFDVDLDSIAWCQEHLTPRDPRFTFDHVDRHDTHRLTYDDGAFDFIIATSPVARTGREETAELMGELSRVLRLDGVVFLTAYLLTPESTIAMAKEGGRQLGEVPEDWLRADARRVGLNVDRIAYGGWSTPKRLAEQDIVLLRRDR